MKYAHQCFVKELISLKKIPLCRIFIKAIFLSSLYIFMHFLTFFIHALTRQNCELCTQFAKHLIKLNKTRPGDLVGAGPNWVSFWSKFGLF